MRRSGPPERRTPLARGKPLERSSAPMKRSTPLSASKAQLSGGKQALAPVKFKAKRPAEALACARCESEGRARRATSWHHWLPQEQIRVYARGLRLSTTETRSLVYRLLRDERNLVALCTDCHMQHEGDASTTRRPLSGEEVPYSAWVFALELGLEWLERMHRLYPGGGRWR